MPEAKLIICAANGEFIEAICALMVATGPDWVMYLLLALAFVALALCIERAFALHRSRGPVQILARSIEAALVAQDWSQAQNSLRDSPSSIAAVARAGLSRAHAGTASAQSAMQAAFAHERKGLENRLAILSTLGTNAPFIGLFGTVIGIILAFEELGKSNASGTSPEVMAAIAEALVATAIGIGVALPCVAAYNFFQRGITQITDDVEMISNFILSHLQSQQGTPGKPEHGS